LPARTAGARQDGMVVARPLLRGSGLVGLGSVDEVPSEFEPSAQPNDAFVKEVFSEPEHIMPLLRGRLSPVLAGRLDWPTIEARPASFVRSSLQQVHSDLLFSVRFVDGREGLLYVLFEHQSTVDPALPLRLLGYVFEVLNRHYEAQGLPLPPVLPFVLHQGPEGWHVSTAFEDLFDLPAGLAGELLPYLPKFRHALLDLTRCDPASEEDDPRLRAILQLMKLAREQRLLEYFRWLAESLAEQIPDPLLARLLLYALHADSDLDVEEIYRNLSSNPQLEQRAMSVAEKLRAQGLERGRMEGRMEGRAEGLWIGKIMALEEFLGLPPTSGEELESSSLAELEARHDRLHRDYEARFKGG